MIGDDLADCMQTFEDEEHTCAVCGAHIPIGKMCFVDDGVISCSADCFDFVVSGDHDEWADELLDVVDFMERGGA